MRLDVRCAVAETIKTPMYQGAQGVNIDEAAAALGALARDVLAAEAEAGEEYQSEIVPEADLRSGSFGGDFGRGGGYGEFGRGGGYGEFGRGGDFGGGLAALENEGPRYEKRRMLDRISAIIACGTALAGAGSDELKARMNDLVGPMTEVTEESAKANATDADVAAAVIELAADVNRLVKGWNAAAAPAEAPAAEPAAEPAEAAPGN
jgi:hypothetical protein